MGLQSRRILEKGKAETQSQPVSEEARLEWLTEKTYQAMCLTIKKIINME